MKSVYAMHLDRHVKLGRQPRKPGGIRLHFSDFVSHAAMPSIPSSCDYSPKAASVLSDIYGNDALGDCVVAAGEHLEGVATGNATGTPFHATLPQIISAYSAIGGYVPGDPSTDNGCNEQDAFRYWQTHGFANGTKLLGAISLNARSLRDVQAACYLFENVFFGIAMPDAWITPFPSGSGFVWGVAGRPDPNNGHAPLGVGFDAGGVKIDTWGLLGTITWEAIAKYCGPSAGGELYSLLTPDLLAKGAAKAPNGVAWGDLIAAFDAMGGHVPIPAPPPAPSDPTMTLTLLQAQLFALDKLHAHPRSYLAKTTAEKLVADSVAMHWVK